MTHVVEHMGVGMKLTGEVMSLSLIAGAFMDVLPAIAALVAIVWHGLLIYDWAGNKFGRRKEDKKNKKE